MNTEKLMKTLPIIQNQLDALLDFQVVALARRGRVCTRTALARLSVHPSVRLPARDLMHFTVLWGHVA